MNAAQCMQIDRDRYRGLYLEWRRKHENFLKGIATPKIVKTDGKVTVTWPGDADRCLVSREFFEQLVAGYHTTQDQP